MILLLLYSWARPYKKSQHVYTGKFGSRGSKMRFKKFDNVTICMEPLLCVLGL